MKKLISAVLSIILSLSIFSVTALGVDAAVNYEQPFAAGTAGSQLYRIPAILTLNDGSVMAVADMRYNHGVDSPANIDTLVAISPDGYTGWSYTVLNHFADYADGFSNAGSASFIDSVAIQSSTGRIFVLTDLFPSGYGAPNAMTGTGFAEIDGVQRLLVTDGAMNGRLDTYKYYVSDFVDGKAAIIGLDGAATDCQIDEEFYLYVNGEAVYMGQTGSGDRVQQNIFFADSLYHVYATSYLSLRTSDDNGETWSAPKLLNGSVKKTAESFFGVGPGRGFVTTVNGTERILFPVYDNARGNENVSTIYSDDNGETWVRGAETNLRIGVGKTSEAQFVSLPDGSIRLYARNTSGYIVYADSTDGGVSWSKFRADTNLPATSNCMISFINYSKTINGKSVIIGSYSGDRISRADGIVAVGTINDDNSVNWITKYHVNDGFFAYSCLTELADGNIGFLFEDEAAKISYSVLTVSDSGAVSEINGNNVDFSEERTLLERIRLFFAELLTWLRTLFGVL